MRTIRIAMAAIVLALPGGAGAQGQGPSVDYPGPKQQQPPRPKDVIQSVLGNLNPRRTGPDWDRPADLVQVPIQGFRGQRFDMMTHENLPGWNPAMRLYHAGPGATLIAEFSFKVSMKGINQLTFDCELVSSYVSIYPLVGSEVPPPTQLLAATRHTFALSGPGSGRVRIGFRPAAADNPEWLKAAICRMEAAGVADGAAWRTHERIDFGLTSRESASRPVLIEQPSGRAYGSGVFLRPPIATAYAFERDRLDL